MVKLSRYSILFQLKNDRRTALRAPQCASPYVVDILLNAGASFSSPILSSGHRFPYLGTNPSVIPRLTGDYHDQYIDDISEYFLDILSRDAANPDFCEGYKLCALLTEICCGRSPELWDTWRQARGLPADMVFSPCPLVDEIDSTITIILQSRPEGAYLIYGVLIAVFRTGDIDVGKEILSLLVTRGSSFSAVLGRAFSWEQTEMWPPVDFLDNKGSGIQKLLEEYGADPNCIMYYTMVSVRDIAYWEEAIANGVDEMVLNSLLLISAGAFSTRHVELLLSSGASVNFQGYFGNRYPQGWTALA